MDSGKYFVTHATFLNMSNSKLSRKTQYFTVAEANAHIAALDKLFINIMQLRTQIKTLHRKLDSLGYAPKEAGTLSDNGDIPSDVQRYHAQFFAMLESLKEHIQKIKNMGCVIKDIEIGLVDWPAREQGREILLCWRFGEKKISRWHEQDTGFAQRKPISELSSQVIGNLDNNDNKQV